MTAVIGLILVVAEAISVEPADPNRFITGFTMIGLGLVLWFWSWG